MISLFLAALGGAAEVDVAAGTHVISAGPGVMVNGDVGWKAPFLPDGLGLWTDLGMGPQFPRWCRGVDGCGAFITQLVVGPRYHVAMGDFEVYADTGIGVYLQAQRLGGGGGRNTYADLDLQLGGGVRVPLGDNLDLDFDLEGHVLDGRYPMVLFGGGLVFEIGDDDSRKIELERKRKKRADARKDSRFLNGLGKDFEDVEERVTVRDRLADVPKSLKPEPGKIRFGRTEKPYMGSPATYQEEGVIVFADDWFEADLKKQRCILIHELAHRWAQLNNPKLNDFAKIGWNMLDKTWSYEELNKRKGPLSTDDLPSLWPNKPPPSRFKDDNQAAQNPSEDFGVSVEMYVCDKERFKKNFPDRAAWIEKNLFPPPKPGKE